MVSGYMEMPRETSRVRHVTTLIGLPRSRESCPGRTYLSVKMSAIRPLCDIEVALATRVIRIFLACFSHFKN
jgi:hypothetical protein